MTIPAAGAEQTAVPSRVITERVREPGPQTDSATPQEDAEGEFSDLLTKLKSGSERNPEDAATNLPAGGSAPSGWREVRQRGRESWVGEKRGEGDKDARAASDDLPDSDIDRADASLPEAPPKTGDPNVPAVAVPNADAAAAESIAAILTLTSGHSAVKAPAVSDQAAEVSQRTGRGVPPNAIIQATLESETRVAGQVVPTPKGHAAGKDEVRSRAPVTDLKLPSPAEVAKTAMPGVVVPSASNDVPKANVLRQEAHFPPVVPPAMHARGGVAAVAGSKLATGSETKGNESAALPIDTGSISAEAPASGAVPPPTQQIANRITAEIAAFEVVDRAQAEPNQVAAKPVLKVLQIQLQPAELGTVTVRMELRDSGLEVHVEAAKAETAEILRGDKDTLSNLLKSSGYNVDASSIRVMDGDRTAASQQTGQQGAQTNMQSSTQSQYGGAERDAREHRGNGGSSGGDTPTQANGTDIHESNTSRTSGGLYI
jgi:chemotaxis protein MotD